MYRKPCMQNKIGKKFSVLRTKEQEQKNKNYKKI